MKPSSCPQCCAFVFFHASKRNSAMPKRSTSVSSLSREFGDFCWDVPTGCNRHGTEVFYSRNFRSPNQKTHHVILVFFWLRVSCSCFLFEQKTLFQGWTVSFREGCSLEFFCFSQIYLGMTSCFRVGHSAVTVTVFKPNPQKKLHNFPTPLLLALLFSFRHLKMQGKKHATKKKSPRFC